AFIRALSPLKINSPAKSRGELWWKLWFWFSGFPSPKDFHELRQGFSPPKSDFLQKSTAGQAFADQ
ncbi:MAG: hypothetical protein KDI39_21035, partial [Pseudomonadales bacterium]|nr:hypothetical protein [Pseudomonadales bacterium]